MNLKDDSVAHRKTARKAVRTTRRAPKSAGFKWPTAFRLIPKPVRKQHAHILGAEGIPPCPPDCTYWKTIEVDGELYCVYRCGDGSLFMIKC